MIRIVLGFIVALCTIDIFRHAANPRMLLAGIVLLAIAIAWQLSRWLGWRFVLRGVFVAELFKTIFGPHWPRR